MQLSHRVTCTVNFFCCLLGRTVPVLHYGIVKQSGRYLLALYCIVLYDAHTRTTSYSHAPGSSRCEVVDREGGEGGCKKSSAI